MPIYVVDKPLGMSSHDVVAQMRKRLQTRRVGHAGTLDPLASGVLVILAEDSTKLSPFLSAARKRYLAWVSFGASSRTLDAEGPIVERADASSLTRPALFEALAQIANLHEQLPPQYSAIKQGGVKGYEAARQGNHLDLPARPVHYYQLRLLGFAQERAGLPTQFAKHSGLWQPDVKGFSVPLPEPLATLPTALLDVEVQAGTYIRAMARDLGIFLGVPAHLSGLVRTQSGRLELGQVQGLESIDRTSPSLSNAEVLPYPQIVLDDDQAQRVRYGQRIPLPSEGRYSLLSPEGDLLAIAEREQEQNRLLRVWL